MKKKTVTAILMLLLAFGIAGAVGVMANEISVTIDGIAVDFEGQPPTIVDGRTLVPVRGVFEHLGFTVSWEQSTQQVILLRNSDLRNVIIFVGRDTFTANGAFHELEVPAQIIDGRTMLPIRAVLESVGYEVDWHEATNTVVVTSPDTPISGNISNISDDRSFNFAFAEGYIPDLERLAFNEEMFTWVVIQGGLWQVHGSLMFGHSMTFGIEGHGVHGLYGLFDVGILEGANVGEIVEALVWISEFENLGFYLLRSWSTLHINEEGTFAILSIPAWYAFADIFTTFFFAAQEMPNGDILSLHMFIFLNELTEADFAFLDAFSEQLGYDFLATAAGDMERALAVSRFMMGIFGDDSE
ncbi:MAG: copper amine oxidase N-terminal domain-containing protein [Defluviitaleaceae bacterium]|nr:copper amine oxidase N-terminal domain-containing protein [Defluviitaleaceae bacterium]